MELVTTDGFLLPQRGAGRARIYVPQGLPGVLRPAGADPFRADVKAGKDEVTAPVYSHLIYDIVPEASPDRRRPDILIVEGINVLQSALPGKDGRTPVARDYFDFASTWTPRPRTSGSWYVDRLLALRRTAFTDPRSYFHTWAVNQSEAEATEFAEGVWRDINERTLWRTSCRPAHGRHSSSTRLSTTPSTESAYGAFNR